MPSDTPDRDVPRDPAEGDEPTGADPWPSEPASEDSGPSESWGSDTWPSDPAAEGSGPSETWSSGTWPSDPESSEPGESWPDESSSDDPVPSDYVPDESGPSEPVWSIESLSSEPAPTEAVAPVAPPIVAPPVSPPAAQKRSRKERKRAKRGKVRARKVVRVIRHVDTWSVFKVSVIFFMALFVVLCVASAALWSAARSSGVIDDVESFLTSNGGFGNCENVAPSDPSATTTTELGATTSTIEGGGEDASSTTVDTQPVDPGSDDDCPDGQELVGDFQFEGARIFQAFALAGVVLVFAGAGGAVVLALLFNVISDVTGGVRVTVLEEERQAGSPPDRDRG